MKKKISIGTAIVFMLLGILITFQLSYVAISKKYETKLKDINESQQQYEKIKSIENLFDQQYIGSLDAEKLTDSMIEGYIAGTGDPYANYMNAQEFAEYVKKNSGASVGIGIRVVFLSAEQSMQIVTVLPSSPAEAAGLLPGDRIIKVNGESVSDLGYQMAVSQIQGEEGSYVELNVLRGSNPAVEHTFYIERKVLSETTVSFRMYDEKIGIIRIMEFSRTTPTGVKNAVESLKKSGAERLVFDVRSNPGGDLDGVCETLDYLLPEGPIVRLVDKNGKEELRSSEAGSIDMPMVVLINSNTASAAELFAKALWDYQKATLVGTTTFGKGTAQSILRLPDNSAVAISTHTYYPPYSDNYDGVGVKPDVEVELSENAQGMNIYQLPDSEDAQLLRGVEVLRSIEQAY
mgnify:CR=1 FL=1